MIHPAADPAHPEGPVRPAVAPASRGDMAGAWAGEAPIYDPLTGLPNRALFVDRLTKAMASAQRDGRMIGIMALTLDFGGTGANGRDHDDRELAKEVAARLLGNLRATDSVARLDERTFGIIQVGIRHADDCFTLCRRLQRLFALPADGAGRSAGRLTIGAAIADSDREPAEAWLKRAEKALGDADRRGCTFADPVHVARWNDRLNGERELRQAIREEQFELNYLPVVEPSNRNVVGLEALIRWRHPSRGLLPPGVFLPLAEGCGLMEEIGRWVLQRACADAAGWPSPLPKVMVNVSVAQFRHGDLIAEVGAALDASGLAPDRLVLEIREDVLLDHADIALPVLNALRPKGVGLALDDFGTGRSSLNVLQWFAFDRIKIDQRLIADITRHPAAATIARAIIAVGRAMGVRITAEGVDSSQKLALLLQEGCDEVQGFYLARPLPNREIHRMVELIRAHQAQPFWTIAQPATPAELQA